MLIPAPTNDSQDYLTKVGNIDPRDFCFYCGVKLTDIVEGKKVKRPSTMRTKDHIIPRSRNGVDARINLVWCCNGCNNHKGCLTLEEYRVVVAYKNGKLFYPIRFRFPGEKQLDPLNPFERSVEFAIDYSIRLFFVALNASRLIFRY